MLITKDIIKELNKSPEWLTVDEFSEKYHINPITIRQWINRGHIETFIKIGRDIFIAKNTRLRRRDYGWTSHIFKEGEN